MQPILWLAVVVALSTAFPSDTKQPLVNKVNITFEKQSRMSDSNKAILQQAMHGINIETRRERLLSLNEKIRIRITSEKTEEIKEKLKSIRPVHTERPNENALDLFELNEKEGVDEYMYQGDIHLTEAQLDNIEKEIIMNSEIPEISGSRAKRQATTEYWKKWPNNVVYYYFDPSINARKKASVYAATVYLQSKTCVAFSQSNLAYNRIRIYNGPGCSSAIGMIGGEQELSLGDGCEVIGTVAHEFTHSLGVWHTQSRSDRDDYVTVDFSTIQPTKVNNFEKQSSNNMILFTPYEYGSFMHYGANSFVKTEGQISIIPKDTEYVYTMGNRQISFYDIKMINDFYGCSALCPAATSAQCQNGGVPNPRNCAICNCPLGYAGNLCDQRPAGCGESLTATDVWQTVQFTFGDSTDNQNVRDDFTLCNHWISAPAGMKVQTKITSMFNSQCQYGCPFNGIEIKRKADKQVTNPRYCCDEFNNVELTSELNPTPIISFNRYYYTRFQVQYRYVRGDTPVPTTSSSTTTTTTPATTTSSTTSTTTVPTTTSSTTTTAPLPPITTTTTTTTAPPPTTTTSATTAARPILSYLCADALSTATCIGNKAAGFCSSLGYTFQMIKYNCASTCGFCGKAAPKCVDLNADCAQMMSNGMCDSLKPLLAEYQCARTCGFCTNPV